MSNLKLPRMTFENLSAKSKSGKAVKVAYATHVIQDQDGVTVLHHGNPIALLTETSVTLSNAGWNSRTTANRLHTIAMDNGANFGIGIKGGVMEVRHHNGGTRPMKDYETFQR